MKISPKKTSEGILLSFEDYKKLMERLEDLEDSLELKKAIEEEEKSELLTLGESSFSKDWINEKEDEIWKDL